MMFGVANACFGRSKAQRGGEQTRATRHGACTDAADRSEAPHARRVRGQTIGFATVMMTKAARPTTRTRRPARPLRGRVEVEPPSATGETARRRGGDGEDGPDGEDASPLAVIPRACRYRALDRYRRDGATPR